MQVYQAVATGDVVLGGLGAAGQAYPALMGEAPSAAEGMLAIAREAGPSTILIGEETYRTLGFAQRQFVFGRFGRAQVRGLGREIGIHEVKDRLARLAEPPRLRRSEPMAGLASEAPASRRSEDVRPTVRRRLGRKGRSGCGRAEAGLV